MRCTWLADVLRAAGCKVHEVPGWQERGKDLTAVNGIVWHHTATGTGWTDTRVAELLRDGRSDLAGPLSQLGLQRDSTFVVVAAGKANHNGYGEWGNQAIGIEAYNDGVGEPWPPDMVQAWVKGTAAICAHLLLGPERVKGHKETDPGRKIDPAGLDMGAMRQRIAPLITYRPPQRPKDEPLMVTPDDEKKIRAIVADEIAKAINPDRKGNLLVRIRDSVAKTEQRVGDLVTGARPGK